MTRRVHPARSSSFTALCFLLLFGAPPGCASNDAVADDKQKVTDINQTPVERQSIGNCWLYAEASWVESMHLSATGEAFDTSQSYWTYWDWFAKLGTSDFENGELSTGGWTPLADQIIRDRGVIAEANFLPADGESEMSFRQREALTQVNFEIKEGRLMTAASRRDGKTLRLVLDEAWGLTDDERATLDQVFGENGRRTFSDGEADNAGTVIFDPSDFAVEYTRYDANTGETQSIATDLVRATKDWRNANYPMYASSASKLRTARRNFLKRMQRAMHDRQPVVITWDVDFNAMSDFSSEIPGAFSLANLEKVGVPGRQGGHLTVLEDYQVSTNAFGRLDAAVTLDPAGPEDAKKLDAALRSSSKIEFLRVKNSWGSLRDARTTVPGFPGYHDLYLDYLNGPIQWCPEIENEPKTDVNCVSTTVPFNSLRLPPGY
jgi:hypothetical protein